MTEAEIELRDRIAIDAMKMLVDSCHSGKVQSLLNSEIATKSYGLADAMLAERQKRIDLEKPA